MKRTVAEARGRSPLASLSETFAGFGLILLALAFIDAVALLFLTLLVRDGVWFLAAACAVVTVGLNVVFLRRDTLPFRWLSPGLALIVLLALYPIIYTVYTAFTNYSDGHLLTKLQAVHLIEKEQYLAEGAPTYNWVAYRSVGGDYLLWLTGEDGSAYLARPGAPLEAQTGEAPEALEGYARLDRVASVKYLSELDGVEFGEAPRTVKISGLDRAAQYRQRYVFDAAADALLDRATGTRYAADGEAGAFVSPAGEVLRPGYQVLTGLKNFERLLRSPALRGPFISVFVWTFAFALLSVLTTFALGLLLALVLDGPGLPGRKALRSFLILPYAVPGVISILIWRGLLNPHLGVLTTTLQEWIGWAPQWFADPFWAKFAVLLINLWLGYPYMMLICSGALQAIPKEIYEAAEVDGAGRFQQFWRITLPLLLVSVGPLLVSSFTFNFNNFNVIYLFNEGGPPIPNTPTPAGHTDILISYTYRLAFAGERGSDYGYAAAITFVIFVVISLITLFNFRYTRIWEEVSENV
ncbi:MAG: maltose ABC transporter permease MalF [Anaerolineales bacterium]